MFARGSCRSKRGFSLCSLFVRLAIFSGFDGLGRIVCRSGYPRARLGLFLPPVSSLFVHARPRRRGCTGKALPIVRGGRMSTDREKARRLLGRSHARGVSPLSVFSLGAFLHHFADGVQFVADSHKGGGGRIGRAHACLKSPLVHIAGKVIGKAPRFLACIQALCSFLPSIAARMSFRS